MNDVRTLVRTFLASQLLCVVSTMGADGTPESALVAFSETPDLDIVFGTSHDARKYANLTSNPHVSFVIGFGKTTLQVEGIARMATGEEEERCRTIHTTKNPASLKYAHDPKQRFFVTRPTWMRLTDTSTHPPTIGELRF